MPNKKRTQPVEAALTPVKRDVILASERKQVADYIKRGLSTEEIADKMGLKEQAVVAYEADIYAEWDRKMREDGNKIKSRDFEITEISLSLVTEAVINATTDEERHEAIKTQLLILKRRADMLGYDAKKQLDLTSEGEKITPLAIIGMKMEDL